MIAEGELDWAVRLSTSAPTPPHGMRDWVAHLDRPDTPEQPQMNDHVAEDEFLQLMYPSKYPTNDTPYVSPYNLDERAKKLNDPNGPEFPCICDEDCICAALCASDPTQNCLCEENSLFVRVTEGMDIDDLDVPDLVRRRRSQNSLSTRSSETTTARVDESVVDEAEDDESVDDESVDDDTMIDGQVAAQFLAGAAFHQQDAAAAANEISVQTDQQKGLIKDFAKQVAQFDDAASINSSIKSLLHSMYSDDFNDAASMAPSTKSSQFNDAASITPSMASSQFNDDASMTDSFDSVLAGGGFILRGPDGQPMRTSSLAYREALRQPFAKECPHAPKRAPMAQRVFGSLTNKEMRRP